MIAACAANPSKSFQEFRFCGKCLAEPEPLIAEYFCAACRMPFVNRFPLDETGRCALCRLGLQGFDAVYSYGSYEGALRELVHLFKYSGMRPLSRTFGKFLAQALPRDAGFDVIVPMPLHWFKQWQRGFNQSDLLCARDREEVECSGAQCRAPEKSYAYASRSHECKNAGPMKTGLSACRAVDRWLECVFCWWTM